MARTKTAKRRYKQPNPFSECNVGLMVEWMDAFVELYDDFKTHEVSVKDFDEVEAEAKPKFNDRKQCAAWVYDRRKQWPVNRDQYVPGEGEIWSDRASKYVPDTSAPITEDDVDDPEDDDIENLGDYIDRVEAGGVTTDDVVDFYYTPWMYSVLSAKHLLEHSQLLLNFSQQASAPLSFLAQGRLPYVSDVDWADAMNARTAKWEKELQAMKDRHDQDEMFAITGDPAFYRLDSGMPYKHDDFASYAANFEPTREQQDNDEQESQPMEQA